MRVREVANMSLFKSWTKARLSFAMLFFFWWFVLLGDAASCLSMATKLASAFEV